MAMHIRLVLVVCVVVCLSVWCVDANYVDKVPKDFNTGIAAYADDTDQRAAPNNVYTAGTVAINEVTFYNGKVTALGCRASSGSTYRLALYNSAMTLLGYTNELTASGSLSEGTLVGGSVTVTDGDYYIALLFTTDGNTYYLSETNDMMSGSLPYVTGVTKLGTFTKTSSYSSDAWPTDGTSLIGAATDNPQTWILGLYASVTYGTVPDTWDSTTFTTPESAATNQIYFAQYTITATTPIYQLGLITDDKIAYSTALVGYMALYDSSFNKLAQTDAIDTNGKYSKNGGLNGLSFVLYTELQSPYTAAPGTYYIAALINTLDSGKSLYWKSSTGVSNTLVATNTDGTTFPTSSSAVTALSPTTYADHTASFFAITTPSTASAVQDPQFVGFQGQNFQIHGIPDTFFNLITTPNLQVNGRFTYIDSGVCQYNNTECWTHPGTYIDILTLLVHTMDNATSGSANTHTTRILIHSFSHEQGLKAFVDDRRVSVGFRQQLLTPVGPMTVSFPAFDTFMLKGGDYELTAVNSDYFFNLGASLENGAALSAGAKLTVQSPTEPENIHTAYPAVYDDNMHGLIGQTWKRVQYDHHKWYEGEPLEYAQTGPFACDDVYNVYRGKCINVDDKTQTQTRA